MEIYKIQSSGYKHGSIVQCPGNDNDCKKDDFEWTFGYGRDFTKAISV